MNLSTRERYWFSALMLTSASALVLHVLAHVPDWIVAIVQWVPIAGMLWIIVRAVRRSRKT